VTELLDHETALPFTFTNTGTSGGSKNTSEYYINTEENILEGSALHINGICLNSSLLFM